MPPEVTSVAGAATNFGFAGIIFVVWYFDMRKQEKLQQIIADQVEDKRIMREDRAQMREDRNKMLDIISGYAVSQDRTNSILLRIEKKL